MLGPTGREVSREASPNLGVDCVIATKALDVSHDPVSLIPLAPLCLPPAPSLDLYSLEKPASFYSLGEQYFPKLPGAAKEIFPLTTNSYHLLSSCHSPDTALGNLHMSSVI